MITENYYMKNQGRLMREFDKVIQIVRPFIVRRYGEDMAEWLEEDAARQFLAILPTIPYVGGRTNRFTFNLIGAAWLLALYKSLKLRGRPLDEIIAVSMDLFRAYEDRFPRWMMRAVGWAYLHGLYRWQMQRAARRSQKREYADDWVLTYVPGDGETFDMGVDFTQCAICKLCRDHNAEEFLPHMCKVDYIECEMMGIELERKHTLAAGDAVCDFRLRRPRSKLPGHRTAVQ